MLEVNKIYNMDCLKGLKKIKDNSIKLVITDPPYSVGTTSTGNKGDWLDNNLIIPFFEIWFKEIKRVLKKDGEIYINTDWRTYPLIYPIAVTTLCVKNCIVWDYEWIKAGSHYRFSHEFILYATKTYETKRKFSASERDVWRIKPINFTLKIKRHQTEKPLALIRKMIQNSSEEGDLILDTFIGSGTTAVACKQLGRNFIGFEINPEYYKIANERINEEISQTKLNIRQFANLVGDVPK